MNFTRLGSRKMPPFARPDGRQRREFFLPVGEWLEPRMLLDASADSIEYQTISPTWYARVPGATAQASEAVIGPLSAAVGGSGGDWHSRAEVAQWIVRLTPEATREAGSVAGVAELLNRDLCRFAVMRGLGLPGQVLVQADAMTEEVRAALAGNSSVATFEPNAYFVAQAVPNDADFPTLTGLNNVGQFGATVDADIDAPEAWDENTGSTTVVVGVIDSGIDYTHPDLYLNIWINQGEIPALLTSQLVDTDADGRITFYDLNEAANASRVSNLNSNTYIDAGDLFADPRWTDGVDTDRNSFVDDLVGWNFRSATDEPFEPNDPQDVLGHGTHVAGTIGAIGNNSRGVTGINWRSSLMGLKFLDTGNSGQTADAIAAVNYATMMRTQFGEPVRVLNASWGQSGAESPALRAAIEAAGQQEMLFVAAAGNGNILGQGLNLDRDPFFPASSDLGNVISVAASGPADELARFSNFGQVSVDLAAPGIGVLSTLPGGRYGTANGTSMAAPHVAGVAALIMAELPFASSAEVKQAILGTVDTAAAFSTLTSTGGRLNAERALDSNVFAPRASLVSAANITAAGGTENLITARYQDRQGIDDSTIGNGDLIATRQWGPRDTITATLVPGSTLIANGGTDVTATYRIAAPGGSWDPLDFGRYVLSVVGGQVKNANGLNVPANPFGEFFVQIADPAVFYVNTFTDAIDSNPGDSFCATSTGICTLRAAIQESNAAAPASRMIILDNGSFTLSISPVPQASVSFPNPSESSGCFLGENLFSFSDEQSGDLDVVGNVAVFGNQANATKIDAAKIDRVFKVYPGAQFSMNRVEVTGGAAPDGGGILTAGSLRLDLTTINANSAAQSGGGLSVWDGDTTITASTISGNDAQRGGGVFVCNSASVDIEASAIIRNVATDGGGLVSFLGGEVNLKNSTISQNAGGAVIGNVVGNDISFHASLSADGRYIAFNSIATNLVPGDTNDAADVFVYDRQTSTISRVSVAADGTQANGFSESPSISADGRFVTFSSIASNLVPGDTNGFQDVFVFDCQSQTIERVSVATDGTQANEQSARPSISGDGRFVAFASSASNLVPDVSAGVFLYDRQNDTIESVGAGDRPSITANGQFIVFISDVVSVYDRLNRSVDKVTESAGAISVSISADGRVVVFDSFAANLVPGDTNNLFDVFLFDRQSRTIERVSVAPDGTQGNGESYSHSISADGQFVAFSSTSSNLVVGDTNSVLHMYVVNRQSREIERISISTEGALANNHNLGPSISADGRFIAFTSQATSLVEHDYNNAQDVMFYDRQQRRMDSVTVSTGFLIKLESTTIAENQGAVGVSGEVQAHNSLFVRNSLGSVGFESSGFNLLDSVGTVALRSTDMVIGSAGNFVGPLQDNGGSALSHALLSGGPAVDAGDLAGHPASDQRGIARPQDGNGKFGRRTDIGAYEAYESTIRGVVYLDRNRNGMRDAFESGVVGYPTYLDTNKNGSYDSDEPTTSTLAEQGTFSFERLDPGSYWVSAQNMAGLTPSQSPTIERVSVSATGNPANNNSFTEFLSADGRFVVFSSFATNLVTGSVNPIQNVFVVDRQNDTIERVSVAEGGAEGNDYSVLASASADGRFVAFLSAATNLVPGDTNDAADVFVYDRQTSAISRVSVAANGTQSNGDSDSPLISADGRFVTFSSAASNLVTGDTNGFQDVFVFDRHSQTIERVSVSDGGTQGNDNSFSPSISADGRFVAFASDAVNLVPGTERGVFLYDRQNDIIESVGPGSRPSISANGQFIAFISDAVSVYDRLNGTVDKVTESVVPSLVSISADGRFITFDSPAANLVPEDTNNAFDVFLADRQSRTIKRVSVAPDGTQGNANSYSQSISADGRFIAFSSFAKNLAAGTTGSSLNVLLTKNRSAPGADSISIDLFAGQEVSNVDFGLIPNAGQIRGQCFDDVITNGARDEGEPGRADCMVYLDLNTNGRFDPADLSTMTDDDGSYSFANLDTEFEYVVALAAIPSGQSLVLPSANDNGLYKVFLPAGGTIADRDFGLRPASTVGQFENGVIQGRLFVDQAGVVKPGIAGIGLFVDLDDDEVRDFDEPRTISAIDNPATSGVNEAGQYTFSGLGTRPYTVRVQDVPPNVQQKTPIGNSFARLPFSLASPTRLLGSPLDVVVADFNNDNWPDLATVVFDGNAVSILLNDGQGGFVPTAIDISLAPANRPTSQPRGTGPIALVAGNFNGVGGADLAVANSFSSNVAVLLDFNGSGFASETYINVGLVPTGIASGDLETDGDLDLVVTNNLENASGTVKNVSLLRNNGQGIFAAIANPPSAGNNPSAVVTGHFNNDTLLDLAIADFGTHPRGADLGDVRVLLANANGTFQSSNACGIGFGPSAMTTEDLNGDQKLDLAVANFLSDNVTVCLGNGSGGFQATFTLSGGSGPTDIAATDIDNDDDLDLLITNGKSQKAGVLRSRLNQGVFEFDPAESFGAAQFAGVTRLSFAVGDLDRDGDVDLATASSERNEVSIHTNALVGGAQRRALNGVETLIGVDFAFRAINQPPTLNGISSPAAVNEDSGVVTVALSGISAGSGENQPLSVTVSSDNPTLFASATVEHEGAETTGNILLTLADDQFGQALVRVTVTDGGLDNDLDTLGDNATIQQSFTVTVNPLDDPPTVTADDFDVLMNSGPNVLDALANDSIAPDLNETLTLIFVVPPAAAVGTLVIENNRLKYTPAAGFVGDFTTQYFVSDGGVPISVDVSITVNNPAGNPWFNELNRFDVTGDRSVVAEDALAVINFLNAFGSRPVPADAPSGGPFYDVNGDRTVSSGDALDVINYLNAFGPDGEGEARSPRSGSAGDSPNEFSGAEEPSALDDLMSLLALDIASQPKRRR